MSSCKGLHCPGCGDGGGWGVLAVIVLVIVGAAIARPVEHAAVDVLHFVLIALAVLAGTAVAAAGGYAAWRIRRRAVRHQERPAAAPIQSPGRVAGRPAPPIVARRVRQIGPVNRRQAVYSVRVKEHK